MSAIRAFSHERPSESKSSAKTGKTSAQINNNKQIKTKDSGFK
jgi:hypothetical protein